MTLAVAAPVIPPVPVVMPVITDALKAEAVQAMAREAADIAFRVIHGRDPESATDRREHAFRYVWFGSRASKAYDRHPNYSLETRLGVVAEVLGIAVYTSVTNHRNRNLGAYASVTTTT